MAIQIPPSALSNDPFSKWTLTVRETFSLQGFYERLYHFLKEREWVDLHGSTVDDGRDSYEDYYYQKNDGNMKFHNIWWRATKRPKFHGNKYYQFYMTLDIASIAMTDKEVIHDGNKIKLQSGEVRITANFYLVAEDTNPGSTGSQWKESSLLGFYKKNFWNRTNKGTYSAVKAELAAFSNDLYELIQKYTGIMAEGRIKDFRPMRGTHN